MDPSKFQVNFNVEYQICSKFFTNMRSSGEFFLTSFNKLASGRKFKLSSRVQGPAATTTENGEMHSATVGGALKIGKGNPWS
jgi:hypothetical protein